MSRNQRAQALADDWLYWLHTRAFFGPPPPKHIIAMLSMPDTGREPPNASLSAEMASFHIGVIGLPDHLGRAFLRVYCGFPEKPVKTLAYEEGIGSDAYYERAHKGAAMAITTMKHKLAMVTNMGLLKRREDDQLRRA